MLALGALGLVLVLGGVAAVIGYRQAPHRAAARQRPAGRGSAVVRAGLGAGLGAAGVAGLRFALEPGRGRTAVPVRSVLTGAVLAVTVVAATLTFGASLSYLVSRPALYGWDFSYALYSTDGWGPFPPSFTTPLLRRDRLVAASTGVYFLTVQVDGQTVPAILSPDPPGGRAPVAVRARARRPRADRARPGHARPAAQAGRRPGHGAARPGDPRREAADRRHRRAAGPGRHAGDPSLAGHGRDPADRGRVAGRAERGRPGLRSQRHLRAAAARREPGRRPAVAAADHQRVRQDRALAADRGPDRARQRWSSWPTCCRCSGRPRS